MIFLSVQDDVERLQLTMRVINYLHRCGIYTVGEFMKADPERLREEYGVGLHSAEAIRDRQEEIRTLSGNFALSQEQKEESREERVAHALEELRVRHPLVDGEMFLLLAYDIPELRMTVKERALLKLAECGGEMKTEALCGTFPEDIRGTVVQDEILLEMKNSGLIREENGICKSQDMTLEEWIDTQKDERLRDVLNMRFHGYTQAQIGKKYDLTHQRINAMTKDALKVKPALREDRYIYLLENYRILPETFCGCFDEDISVYYYARQMGERGTKKRKLRQAVSDTNIPEGIRRKIEGYL